MGKATVRSNLDQVLLSSQQFLFGFLDLAVEQEVLRSDAEQFRKAPMEMERAQMNRLGNFHERRTTMELFTHELHRRQQPGEFLITLEVALTQRAPVTTSRLQAEEH